MEDSFIINHEDGFELEITDASKFSQPFEFDTFDKKAE